MESCWVCESTDTVQWKQQSLDRSLVPSDFQITDTGYGQTLPLRRCQACSFIFAEAVEAEQLRKLYEQLSDPEYEEGRETRARQMRWLLGLGLAARPGAVSLLDIGAGIGLLVAEAQQVGLTAIGVEPSRALQARSGKIADGKVLQGTFPHPALTGQKFDMIYLVDVIEHVVNPVELLRSCRAALGREGVLVVVTPDVGSALARLLGTRWWHFRLAHVGYFSRSSMQVAAKHAGLQVSRTVPAKWFFPFPYVLERVAVYLPFVNPIDRWARSRSLFRRLYDRVITLSLRDSVAFIMRAEPSG